MLNRYEFKEITMWQQPVFIQNNIKQSPEFIQIAWKSSFLNVHWFSFNFPNYVLCRDFKLKKKDLECLISKMSLINKSFWVESCFAVTKCLHFMSFLRFAMRCIYLYREKSVRFNVKSWLYMKFLAKLKSFSKKIKFKVGKL